MDKKNLYTGLGVMFSLIGMGLFIGIPLAIQEHGLCLFNCY